MTLPASINRVVDLVPAATFDKVVETPPATVSQTPETPAASAP